MSGYFHQPATIAYTTPSIPQLLPLANIGPVVGEQPLKRPTARSNCISTSSRKRRSVSQEDAERVKKEKKLRNNKSCRKLRKKRKEENFLKEQNAKKLEEENRVLVNHYKDLLEEKQIQIERLRRVFMTNLELVETNPDFAVAYRAFAIEDEAHQRVTNTAEARVCETR